MPQQLESIKLTARSGISDSASCTALIAPNAFWWQWPCSKAVFCGSGFSSSLSRPAFFSRTKNSSNRKALSQTALASSPRPMARNSSRRVNRHDGSRPTTGTPLATNGSNACSNRRASLLAFMTWPVARKVRPQHSAGAPRVGQATATRWPAASSTRRAACSTPGSKLLEKVSAKITTVAPRPRRDLRQIADQAVAQAEALAHAARRLHLDLHARHVDAGRAIALAPFAAHAKIHRLGDGVRRQRLRTELP